MITTDDDQLLPVLASPFLPPPADFQVGQYHPDGPVIRLCKGSPPEPTALPALPKTRHRVTVCVHNVMNLSLLRIRFRSEWLRAFFEHYTALGVEHFYLYVR